MNRPTTIGIDPGPIPGIAVIRPDGSVEQLQVTAGLALLVVRALVLACPRVPENRHGGAPIDGTLAWPNVLLAVERFVVSGRSSRSSTPAAGQRTRDMVGELQGLAAELGIPVRLRTASEVERWATAGSPSRLERAGLSIKGMPHARSAGWHALFAAVSDAGAPDPLSRSARPSRSLR